MSQNYKIKLRQVKAILKSLSRLLTTHEARSLRFPPLVRNGSCNNILTTGKHTEILMPQLKQLKMLGHSNITVKKHSTKTLYLSTLQKSKQSKQTLVCTIPQSQPVPHNITTILAHLRLNTEYHNILFKTTSLGSDSKARVYFLAFFSKVRHALLVF